MASTIERALELARSGEYASIVEIERRLQREGYENIMEHLNGAFIRGQLLEAMNGSRSEMENLVN